MKNCAFILLLSLALTAPGLAGEVYTTARPSSPQKAFGEQAKKTASVTISKATEPAEVQVGNPARGFILQDSSGIYHRLREHQGSQILLFFFRADCAPCKQVMAEVIEFHRGYREEIVVLGVALLENPDGRAKLNEYLEAIRPPFPILVDAEEEVADVYFTPGDWITLPALFFIDEEMIVTKKLHRLTRPLSSHLDD